MKYLVSAYWGGALNVDQMRLLDTLSEAIVYRDTLNYGDPMFTRIYEVSKDAPPKLRKV